MSEQQQLAKTPRNTPGFPQILGGFKTLTEGLDYAAQGQTGFNFYAPRGGLEHVLTYRDLRDQARETAKKLTACDLKRGDRVGIVAETGPEFMVAFFACQYAGLVPCPLPYSVTIGGQEAFISRIAGMLNAADAVMALAPEALKPAIEEAALTTRVSTVLTHDELQAIPATGALAPFEPDDVAYIQYSSGSTSAPKGVLISQKAITANTCAILRNGLALTPQDRAFSWLPLYHDMGLVGFCLSPMMGQVTVDYLATTAFARRPALWLKIMSDNKSTICYAPSFGYDLAARRVNGGAKDLDLSSWRVAGIGGDMVRADVLQDFIERLDVAGFKPNAFLPSYGMAESTLAVTFAPLESEITVDVVDRARLKLSGRAEQASLADYHNNPDKYRAFVACGTALPDHEVIVRSRDGKILGEREVGHVLIKGPSLMSGYYRNAEATGEIFGEDGYMDTGDMGYLLNGQIVLTGRAKDLILHNGRNIWPQDIEWAAEQLDELKSGDVAAFGVEDSEGIEHVTVLVQCRSSDPDKRFKLQRDVAKLVHQSAGVECDVALVPSRSLPFTSSGKLSRAGAKARFQSGDIARLEVPEPQLHEHHHLAATA